MKENLENQIEKKESAVWIWGLAFAGFWLLFVGALNFFSDRFLSEEKLQLISIVLFFVVMVYPVFRALKLARKADKSDKQS